MLSLCFTLMLNAQCSCIWIVFGVSFFLFFVVCFLSPIICSEKVAAKNKQRSKCNDIFEEDQKRFNRNSDLLHLIDRIDGKAAVLAARTERCKMLKVRFGWQMVMAARSNSLSLPDAR